MKRLLFYLFILFVCVSCNTHINSYEHLKQTIETRMVNANPPTETFLGINYNMTPEEMKEYLFLKSIDNPNLDSPYTSTFEDEHAHKSLQEKSKIYQSDPKYAAASMYYTFVSEDKSNKLVMCRIFSYKDLRDGIFISYEGDNNNAIFTDVVFSQYEKKYGKPQYTFQEEASTIHYWLTDRNEIIKIQIYSDDENGAYILYADPIHFLKQPEFNIRTKNDIDDI